jgi:hypothetical protein
VADADLEAGDGLALRRDAGGAWRVAWEHADWLGPLGFTLGAQQWDAPDAATRFEGEDALGRHRGVTLRWPGATSGLATHVRAYPDRPLLVLRIEATAAQRGLTTRVFDAPCAAWRFRPHERLPGGLPDDAVAYGHQYTEFALPTFSDASFARFFLLPQRPAVVTPLVVRAGARCLLLAPLDAFHEQVIAVPRGAGAATRELRCGWHGDLDAVPRGFASELALWGGGGVRALLDAWGALLQRRAGAAPRSRYADAAVGRLSYWTDNGAAYWYRSEPGLGVTGTLAAVHEGLREARIPVHAFELDSWFYPHEVTRAFDAPEIDVPPTGMLAWEPRTDALPGGIAPLRRRLGDAPLILHSRHYASRSPYFEREPAWRDGDRAHPVSPAFFARLFAQAEAWGAIQVEQDWLVECFLGVRGLREEPGRATAWQRALDAAAAEHGLSLLWCMASPADLCAAPSLPRVAAVRSSGDYRYVLGNASLWCWFLYGNALARALGLLPFKDVFLSRRDGTGLDGDPHAELEALLAALSAGPVGIGDRAERSDREIILRTCRDDGVLVKPDVPIAALERCFRAHAHLEATPLLGETWSDHPAGRWTYLLAVHASRSEAPLGFEVAPSELGDAAPRGDCVAYDWASGRCERVAAGEALRFSLAPRAWSLRVLCPLLPGELALVGDPTKYACAGDRRIRRVRAEDGGVAFEVLGAPDERVRIRGFAGRAPPKAWARHAEVSPAEALALEPAPAGGFDLRVPVGARGVALVRIEAR